MSKGTHCSSARNGSKRDELTLNNGLQKGEEEEEYYVWDRLQFTPTTTNNTKKMDGWKILYFPDMT